MDLKASAASGPAGGKRRPITHPILHYLYVSCRSREDEQRISLQQWQVCAILLHRDRNNISRNGSVMKILLASPRGFCAGVDRAIEIVERA
ncbi:MAG: hypothetical protein WHZ52_02010, partial [Armatimonadota bacterium]